MSMPAFELDPKAAKSGSGGSGRIDSLGKYVGKIKFCKYWESEKGARMVEIKFEADTGQSANIRICTHSGTAKGNEPTYGYKQFQAVMACIKARSLTPTDQMIDDYDHDAGEVRQVMRTVFKEMTGAPLGLALYRHDQTSNQGNNYFTMEIAAPFNAETEQTAQEVLDQKQAEQLSKIVLSLKDKDSRSSGNNSSPPSSPAMSDFEDDIPF